MLSRARSHDVSVPTEQSGLQRLVRVVSSIMLVVVVASAATQILQKTLPPLHALCAFASACADGLGPLSKIKRTAPVRRRRASCVLPREFGSDAWTNHLAPRLVAGFQQHGKRMRAPRQLALPQYKRAARHSRHKASHRVIRGIVVFLHTDRSIGVRLLDCQRGTVPSTNSRPRCSPQRALSESLAVSRCSRDAPRSSAGLVLVCLPPQL